MEEWPVRRDSSSRACARSRRRSLIHPGRPASEAMAAPAAAATRMTTTRDVSADQIANRKVTGPAFWTANMATRMAKMKERTSAACPMGCSSGKASFSCTLAQTHMAGKHGGHRGPQRKWGRSGTSCGLAAGGFFLPCRDVYRRVGEEAWGYRWLRDEDGCGG